MYPKQHLIYGILFSLILFSFYPKIELVNLSIIFLSSVLIDVDHYLYYVKKKKDWNIKNSYKWFIKKTNKFWSISNEQRKNFNTGFYFLHGLEILLVFFLLSFFLNYFFFIFIGFSFHLLFDIAYDFGDKDRIGKVSLINDYLRFREMNKVI